MARGEVESARRSDEEAWAGGTLREATCPRGSSCWWVADGVLCGWERREACPRVRAAAWSEVTAELRKCQTRCPGEERRKVDKELEE